MGDEWLAKQEKASPELVKLKAENARLQKLLGLVEEYKSGASEPPSWLKPRKKYAPASATACFALSDLHFDEKVNPGELLGLNAYNREIATLRLKRWSEKAVELGERYKHEWDGAWVALNGDLVSGAIHDELKETNIGTLPEAMKHYAPLLAAALRPIADYYGKLHVTGLVGNHGRLTEKKQAKRRARNSWDWLLMHMVQAHFQDNTNVTWEIPDSSFMFVPLYDTFAFQTHGDEVGGGGGWAGIWSPLGTIHRKAVELASAYKRRISYVVVGHWHTTVTAFQRGLSCNGSMKGYDEYAAFLRLQPEPAMQNFWVHTAKHGVTLSAPIFLEDRSAEGW